MKRIILLFIFVFLVVGCKEDLNSNNEVNTKKFVLQKVDTDKELVYMNKYKEILLGENNLVLQYPVINVKSDDVDNVNLEIKSFFTKNYNKYIFENNVLINGVIVDYDYYITSDYISIIEKYYKYMNGIVGEIHDNVYVLSLKNGKTVNNVSLLEKYEISEEDLFIMLQDIIESDDVSFTIMNIKNNGYKLFVDNDSKLRIIYYELTNDEEMRKELVLN